MQLLLLANAALGLAPAAAGCGVLLASVAVQTKLGFLFKRLREQTAKRTDARVRAYHMQRAAAKREKKALRSAMVERRTTLARAARSSVMRMKPRGNRHE